MAVGERVYPGSPNNVTTIVALAGRGTLYEVSAQNNSNNDVWIQIHNASVLVDGASVPDYSFRVPKLATFAIALPSPPDDRGRFFANGCIVAWSDQQGVWSDPDAGIGPIYTAGRLAE